MGLPLFHDVLEERCKRFVGSLTHPLGKSVGVEVTKEDVVTNGGGGRDPFGADLNPTGTGWIAKIQNVFDRHNGIPLRLDIIPYLFESQEVNFESKSGGQIAGVTADSHGSFGFVQENLARSLFDHLARKTDPVMSVIVMLNEPTGLVGANDQATRITLQVAGDMFHGQHRNGGTRFWRDRSGGVVVVNGEVNQTVLFAGKSDVTSDEKKSERKEFDYGSTVHGGHHFPDFSPKNRELGLADIF